MNTLTLYSTMLCLVASTCLAQGQSNGQYSYISDRTFTSPDQLMGYDFKPAMREVPGEAPEEISIGEYSFGITRKNLYVEGPDIQGVYSVNNINTTEYGFMLKTMNARDPTIQGHLKVVVDEQGQVEGLIFKRSNDDKEIIFFLRVISEELAKREAKYFTNKGEQQIKVVDSLWTGLEVRPFLRIYQDMGGVQQRISMTDSVYLNFYKVVSVEEKKGLFQKKSKKGSKDNDEEEIDIPVVSQTAPQRTEQIAALSASENEDLMVDVKGKPGDELLLDGFESAGADTMLLSLDSLTRDSLSLATATNSVASKVNMDSVATQLVADFVPAVQEAIDSSKLKITTEYYVDLNAFMQYDDGTNAMENKTFIVSGIAERENPNAGKGGDRFQWELSLNKRPNAYIYFDEKHRVNSIQIDGQKFYMRGH